MLLRRMLGGLEMKRLFMTMLFVLLFTSTVYAGDNYVTTYSFHNIAGNISGDTINVSVPYSTTTTYWDHKVLVSEGATFYTKSLTQSSDRLTVGKLIVVGSDESQREYTVNINKQPYKEVEYKIHKAKSIRKNKATIKVDVTPNDANVSYVKVVYYTKKNQLSYVSADRSGESSVTLTGLREGTKYYYYLSVQTSDKTFESSSKSFRTKKSSDTTTTSTSTGHSNVVNKTTKGTNASGPGTNAVQDSVTRNTWKLVNNNWLYFGADGFSKVGWYKVADNWYYTTRGTNLLAVNQWKYIDDKWYYFNESGAMVSHQWVHSNGWYWTDEHGALATSQFIDVGEARYLLDPDGLCVSDKVILDNNIWKYCKPNSVGIAYNEQVSINGVKYWADAEGRLNLGGD